jgi:hypothetical protein
LADLARLRARGERPNLGAIEHTALAQIDAPDRRLLAAEHGRILLLELLPRVGGVSLCLPAGGGVCTATLGGGLAATGPLWGGYAAGVGLITLAQGLSPDCGAALVDGRA